MLISTSTTVAFRCPACGRMEFKLFTLFGLKKSCTLSCTCGTVLLTISTSNCQRFTLFSRCDLCETSHRWYYSRQEMLSGGVKEITCPGTDLELGYIGSKDTIQRHLKEQDWSLTQMAQELGYAGYFDSPDLMYDLLDTLYAKAEAGGLKCQCGNCNIEMEIFPNQIELRCGQCGCSGTIGVQADHELKPVMDAQQVLITVEGLQWHSVRPTPRPRRSKK